MAAGFVHTKGNQQAEANAYVRSRHTSNATALEKGHARTGVVKRTGGSTPRRNPPLRTAFFTRSCSSDFTVLKFEGLLAHAASTAPTLVAINWPRRTGRQVGWGKTAQGLVGCCITRIRSRSNRPAWIQRGGRRPFALKEQVVLVEEPGKALAGQEGGERVG